MIINILTRLREYWNINWKCYGEDTDVIGFSAKYDNCMIYLDYYKKLDDIIIDIYDEYRVNIKRLITDEEKRLIELW